MTTLGQILTFLWQAKEEMLHFSNINAFANNFLN